MLLLKIDDKQRVEERKGAREGRKGILEEWPRPYKGRRLRHRPWQSPSGIDAEKMGTG